jgi:superfamily II DNA or RNA helicase
MRGHAAFIGLTATPCRGDGRGLGNVFDALIECPQIGELIELGYLVKPKIFAPALPDLRGVEVASRGDYQINQLSARMDTDALVGDVVEHWLRHAQRRRTVMFAVDIAHSVHIVRELVKSGVKAEHISTATHHKLNVMPSWPDWHPARPRSFAMSASSPKASTCATSAVSHWCDRVDRLVYSAR